MYMHENRLQIPTSKISSYLYFALKVYLHLTRVWSIVTQLNVNL